MFPNGAFQRACAEMTQLFGDGGFRSNPEAASACFLLLLFPRGEDEMDLLKAEVERKRKLVEEKELLAVRGRAYLAGLLLWGESPSRRRKFGLFRARDAIKGGKTGFFFLKKKAFLAFLGGVHGACPTLQGCCYWRFLLGGPLEEEIRVN